MQSYLEKLIAIFFLILFSPLLPILFVAVKVESKGPFIFRQRRMGKNKKPFVMYKIRTMIDSAEKLKEKYKKLNEADGPVFKIKDDPRYTPLGKIMSHLAIDELPQFINVIKGDMALVGPRPLPIKEAQQIPQKYQIRFSVLPGMTSPWIINGAHNLTFKQWMDMDVDYIKNKSLFGDLSIFLKTFFIHF